MEKQDLFEQYAAIDAEIGWQNAIEEAAVFMAEEAANRTVPGNVLTRKYENLMSTAESARGFIDMQRLAAFMGDLCCNNPAVSEIFRNSPYLQDTMNDHSNNDGHNHADEHRKNEEEEDDRYEIDPITGKRRLKILAKPRPILKLAA